MALPPLQARRSVIWRLMQEIHNTASCLSAGRAVICQEVGLSAERWRALVVLRRSSYLLSISDLARQLRLSRQSVHQLTVGLERARWIRFLPNSCDRRLLQMEITDAGRSILSAVENRLNAWLVKMFDNLEERELRKLVNTMRALRGRIARTRDYL
jgi:DNA-binding MarR family transcriptional regulator